MFPALLSLTLGTGPFTQVALADGGDAAPLAITADEPPPAIPAAQPPPAPPGPPAIPARGQPVGPPAQVRTMQQGYSDGALAAQREPMLAWGAASAGSSCLFGPVGCLGVTGVAAFSEPSSPAGYYQGMSVPGEADYWQGYREGYSHRLRARRTTAAFVGGSIATGIVAVVVIGVVAAASDPVYYYY